MSWQDYIVSALQYDVQDFTIEDIESGIASGAYQLWETEGASMITAGFYTKAGGIGVNIVAVGGELDAAFELLDKVEAEARLAGCELIRFVGRLGWKKEVQKRSFKHTSSVFVKNLQ
jgi:hypothetical protein